MPTVSKEEKKVADMLEAFESVVDGIKKLSEKLQQMQKQTRKNPGNGLKTLSALIKDFGGQLKDLKGSRRRPMRWAFECALAG